MARGRPRKVTNHLAGVSEVAVSAPADRETVSCRKINNGFLISKSGVKNGKYFDEEWYSPKAPNFDIPKKKV